jgi:hypothetical protein
MDFRSPLSQSVGRVQPIRTSHVNYRPTPLIGVTMVTSIGLLYCIGYLEKHEAPLWACRVLQFFSTFSHFFKFCQFFKNFFQLFSTLINFFYQMYSTFGQLFSTFGRAFLVFFNFCQLFFQLLVNFFSTFEQKILKIKF